MGRRGYPPEVRERALELVTAGRSVYLVARELGISVQVIYHWRTQERLRAGRGEVETGQE